MQLTVSPASANAHRPPAAAPAAAAVSNVLLDDAHTRIDHYPGTRVPGTVVITFDPLLYLWPKPPFGLDFLLRQGVTVVAVRRKSENFYQALGREAFLAAVQPVLKTAQRILAYGSSLGAYAALYYARTLHAEVLALSPRVSAHPVFGHPTWQEKARFEHQVFQPGQHVACRAIVIYDPRDATDKRYIEEEVLPTFHDARVVTVPFAGHPSSQFLGDIGFLPGFVRALTAGQALPVLERRQRRAHSATYHQVLSEHCLRHGRVAAAAVLIERSLALRPRNLLALRTRGQARAALQDWPEALASLEAARALDPADPWTNSLLKQARLQAASAHPVPTAKLPLEPSPQAAPAACAVPAAVAAAVAKGATARPSFAARIAEHWRRAWQRWRLRR